MLFPAREMGQQQHSNQFNFDITNPAQYYDTYSDSTSDDGLLCASTNTPSAPWSFSPFGSDNIAAVQASGYPAQNNHPGITDTIADVISTFAHGADAVEVVGASNFSSTWDAILQQNHQVIGTYGTDSHAGVGNGAPADYIDAPSLTRDNLLTSLFEGRMFMARNNFGGRIAFNLDPSSASPYPARYPVYVPAGQSSANVHLSISSGLTAGQTVNWVYNSGSGSQTITDTPSGASYDVTKAIPLSGSFTFVRAEIRDSLGNPLAHTEPIFFKAVSGLPAGMSVHVDSFEPASGCACSVGTTKGITAATWSGGVSRLSLTLTDQPQTKVDLLVTSGIAPQTLTIDGSSIAPSASLSAFQAATGSAWFYDSGAGLLYLRDLQGAGASSSIGISFGPPDTEAPSVPAGVTATAIGASEIDVSWTASSDNDAVAGYHVFRDGGPIPIATVTSGTTYADTGLAFSSTHSYTVSAFDAVPNESAPSSPPASATTSTTATFTPVADSYVDSSQAGINFGTSNIIRVDASPTVRTYLKFNVNGVPGTATQATLRVFANSALNTGYDVFAVSDTSWIESGTGGITYTNAPPLAATKTGSSGPVSAGTWTTVNVTALISGNGTISIALTTTSSTALSMQSRTGANPPQLIVTAGSTRHAGAVGADGRAGGRQRQQRDRPQLDGLDDNTAVTGYHVFRDSNPTPLATVTSGTTYADTGLAAGSHPLLHRHRLRRGAERIGTIERRPPQQRPVAAPMRRSHLSPTPTSTRHNQRTTSVPATCSASTPPPPCARTSSSTSTG